jgi:hypothetical protein
MINNIITAFNKLTGKNVPLLSDAMKNVAGIAEKTISDSQKKISELETAKLAHTKRTKEQEIEMQKAAEKAKQEEAKKSTDMSMQVDAENFAKKMEVKAAQNEAEKTMRQEANQEEVEAERIKNEQIKAAQEELFKAKLQFMQDGLSTTQTMLGDLQTVFKNAGKESRELAKMMKALAIAEATINSFRAFNNALASPLPWPLPQIAAGLALGAGLAKVAAIASTPIPSAQTGGQFTVPDTPATRNDRAAVMASAGETVTVSPRGEGSGKDMYVNIELAEGVLFRAVQRGIDTGKINISSRNIGRAVFA